ncbi:oxidoreductase [Nitratidesulfovibrio sp. D1]|uniref:oxidoreductase n=1 Tax=Nitratidesulfovibrio sp. D1 TaxID=3440151 RepID=UPI003EBFBEF8
MSTARKIWLITGASSGFGKSLAEAVIARGDCAVITARRLDRLQAIARGHEDRVLPLAVDMTDAAARGKAVADTLARFGRIDVLANVAGSGSMGAAEEFSEAELRAQFELNFFATAEMTRAVLPQMRAQGSGRILTVTSVGGLVAITGCGPYCASKFALECWSEALAMEVAPLGIRVTIVEPGSFRTGFAGDVNVRPAQRIESYRPVVGPVEDFLERSAGKEIGDPARAAAVIIAAVESDAPPIRLMLGEDAYALWDQTIAKRIEDIDAWRERGLKTAFDGAAFTPIGG